MENSGLPSPSDFSIDYGSTVEISYDRYIYTIQTLNQRVSIGNCNYLMSYDVLVPDNSIENHIININDYLYQIINKTHFEVEGTLDSYYSFDSPYSRVFRHDIEEIWAMNRIIFESDIPSNEKQIIYDYLTSVGGLNEQPRSETINEIGVYDRALDYNEIMREYGEIAYVGPLTGEYKYETKRNILGLTKEDFVI